MTGWTAMVAAKRGWAFCCAKDHLTQEAALRHGAEKAGPSGRFDLWRLGSREGDDS